MTPTAEELALLGAQPTEETLTVARNVSTRYLAILIEMVVGLVVLPFNVSHLGKAAYGLWMLTASVTAYFSILDMGYSGALVKFTGRHQMSVDVTKSTCSSMRLDEKVTPSAVIALSSCSTRIRSSRAGL